ncbi:MAG TPA: carboxypeptidase-like regulatory domain-containing protein [Candidatus Acidoferrum sp.]
MHRPLWVTVLCTAMFVTAVAAKSSLAQEPPPTVPAPPTQGTSSSKLGKTTYSHKNDFVIRGTVFNDKDLSAPGAQLRIRRVGEKKFRWESYTNSRGEFAVRVPQGSDYEMVVRAKGFVEQTRNIDAKSGANEERMVFRLELAAGEKK